MVVFTCGHCGESVQKPKVEKHYMTKCRNRNANLSCMDCFKDFFGKDYEFHTKCVTEEQRYSAKGFVAKEKKGEQKQTVWVDLVQSVLQEQTNATKNVLKIIETVSKHTNTPRKKPKFINFVKNVCGHKTNANDIETAWNMISVKLTELSIANQSKNLNKSQDLNNSSNSNDNTVEDKNVSVTEEQDNKIEVETNDKVETKTKKQMKEEKKRKKYEDQLNSVAKAPEETEEEVTKPTKKEKKSKNKTNETNGDTENVQEQTNDKKNKKRKRIDTVNEVNGATDKVQNENGKVLESTSNKPDKKKQKEEMDISISLHDQNVAATEELDLNKGKFDWHATIISVLQKKGNEIPFKRLQKKVLGEYSESTGCAADDRIADKFIKKLKSAPKVKVDKNRVYLED